MVYVRFIIAMRRVYDGGGLSLCHLGKFCLIAYIVVSSATLVEGSGAYILCIF